MYVQQKNLFGRNSSYLLHFAFWAIIELFFLLLSGGFFFYFYNHSVKILFRAFVTLTLQVTAAQWGSYLFARPFYQPSIITDHLHINPRPLEPYCTEYLHQQLRLSLLSQPVNVHLQKKLNASVLTTDTVSRLWQVRLQRVPIKHSTCCKREKILGPGYDE